MFCACFWIRDYISARLLFIGLVRERSDEREKETIEAASYKGSANSSVLSSLVMGSCSTWDVVGVIFMASGILPI